MKYIHKNIEKIIKRRVLIPCLIKEDVDPFTPCLAQYESNKFFPSLFQREISEVFKGQFSLSMGVPLLKFCVQAGEPLSTAEFVEEKLDLKEHLIKNEKDTFLIRVSGESMIDAGIFPDDLLVVDRAAKAISGNIIIALLNGGLTVKRLYQHKATIILCSENKDFSDIKITPDDKFSIWGVVTNAIRSLA